MNREKAAEREKSNTPALRAIRAIKAIDDEQESLMEWAPFTAEERGRVEALYEEDRTALRSGGMQKPKVEQERNQIITDARNRDREKRRTTPPDALREEKAEPPEKVFLTRQQAYLEEIEKQGEVGFASGEETAAFHRAAVQGRDVRMGDVSSSPSTTIGELDNLVSRGVLAGGERGKPYRIPTEADQSDFATERIRKERKGREKAEAKAAPAPAPEKQTEVERLQPELEQLEKAPAYQAAKAKGLMESYTPEESDALRAFFSKKRDIEKATRIQEFPDAEFQELRERAVSAVKSFELREGKTEEEAQAEADHVRALYSKNQGDLTRKQFQGTIEREEREKEAAAKPRPRTEPDGGSWLDRIQAAQQSQRTIEDAKAEAATPDSPRAGIRDTVPEGARLFEQTSEGVTEVDRDDRERETDAKLETLRQDPHPDYVAPGEKPKQRTYHERRETIREWEERNPDAPQTMASEPLPDDGRPQDHAKAMRNRAATAIQETGHNLDTKKGRKTKAGEAYIRVQEAMDFGKPPTEADIVRLERSAARKQGKPPGYQRQGSRRGTDRTSAQCRDAASDRTGTYRERGQAAPPTPEQESDSR